jgi:hypothetical protein
VPVRGQDTRGRVQIGHVNAVSRRLIAQFFIPRISSSKDKIDRVNVCI